MEVKRKPKNFIKTTIICSLLLLCYSHSTGQEKDILSGYINEGLKNNLTLKQKQASYNKSLQALKESKGLFMPGVSVHARYTVAEGGRLIEFPIGDMLNPVYSTLNALTSDFPYMQLENEEFQFYRPTEHETKLRMIQPIYNPQIIYNKKIKAELVNTEKANAETYKRYLVAEIKAAYFNYLKTIQINQLLEKTTDLLNENIRVNKSLYQNDIVTLDNVYRAQSELSKLEQQKAEAQKGLYMAHAYFNFLLNRPLDTEIASMDSLITEPVYLTIGPAQEKALQNREELQMLTSYQNISLLNTQLNSSYRYPTVLALVDYGFQGTQYEFTGEHDYLLASITLQWDIFKGFQNNAKMQQAIIEEDIIKNKHLKAEAQIRLEVQNAYFTLQAASKNITSAYDQAKTAIEAFRLIELKYAEGQANQLEYTDARTTMTNAEMNLIIAQYDYHVQYAQYERITCLYDLTNYENE